MSKDEHVLGFPSRILDRLGRFQGYSNLYIEYINECLTPVVAEFRSRLDCEEDPEFKQIIPYVVYTYRSLNPDSTFTHKYFCYYRGKTNGESRLRGLRSLGIGGHVNDEDTSGMPNVEGLMLGLNRELDEEIVIGERTFQYLQPVGLINDDRNEVGAVHFGIVFINEITNNDIKGKEADIMDGMFLTKEEILKDHDSFETWSQILIEQAEWMK